MSVKKKVIYFMSFVLIGVIIGVGYWIFTVGSATLWNGKSTVDKQNQGTVKEDEGKVYVEIYVDRYETVTGTLYYKDGKYGVDIGSATLTPNSPGVVVIKSQSGRVITSDNARWYRKKRVNVIVKKKVKMIINPEEAKNVIFIDPVSKSKIRPTELKEYTGKQIIVVRKMVKPAVWLVAGIDSRNGLLYGHNDSVMLLFINPSTSSITILSLPRDTIVYIPRLKSYTKLAHAFIYSKAGDPEDGARSLIETLEYNFGVHIDRYIIFSFKGIADVIDAIGGIDVELNHRICCHSHDWACRGGTCLGPGKVHLDGRKFLVFWRSRTSDIERVERQMSFLTSPEIKEQVIHKLSLSLADNLIKIWGNEVVSDTSPDKWIKLAYDIHNYHINADTLKVYDIWGCYASDLTVSVSALKFDDTWLKDFYVRVFGPELASNYISGIHPDKNVAPLGHCVEEHTSTTASSSHASEKNQAGKKRTGEVTTSTTTPKEVSATQSTGSLTSTTSVEEKTSTVSSTASTATSITSSSTTNTGTADVP